MIIIPEREVYIKVPKAASTTIARLFWSRHRVDQFAKLEADVATAIRHFLPLDKVGGRIPVLNGNWFYNRSGAFGWHASYADLSHIFGAQLQSYRWVASVRHPVSRLFSVFSFQVAKGRISASLTAEDFAAFCEQAIGNGGGLSPQQVIHTWSQSAWLPPVGTGPELSILRQEDLSADLEKLSGQVPSFSTAKIDHINRSFDGDLDAYISPGLRQKIETHYAVDMARFGY